MEITLITTFEITTKFNADNYLQAVEMNSKWLEEEYGNLEEHKIGLVADWKGAR